MVADRENSALAGRLIEETCNQQGVQPDMLTLHSDRGSPMTSKGTAQLLADLGITWLGHTLAIEFMLLPGGSLISDLALNSDASATGGGLCHAAERPSRWAAAEIVTRHTACMIFWVLVALGWTH